MGSRPRSVRPLLAIVIGGKLSKDILPPSTSRSVEDAVNEVIRCNSTDDYLSRGRIGALKILSNTGETASDEVFNVVFETWRTCHRLLIDYRNSKDERSQRVIEPHAIVFYDMQWSIKAYCPDKGKWLTFLVSRIDRAYRQEERFTPSQKEIDAITPDNYYGFPSAGGVRIRLTRRGLPCNCQDNLSENRFPSLAGFGCNIHHRGTKKSRLVAKK